MIALPLGLVRANGSLDVYEDVLKLFRPTYQNNMPTIQCGGWVGYIPLNDKLALDVSPRVPIGNLERLIGMSIGYTPKILSSYDRLFADGVEQPGSLVDVLADQLLSSFDLILANGLLKEYHREQRVSSSPVGRIVPFTSELRSAQAGRPLAVSSSFQRSINTAPNRIISYAVEKLLARYVGNSEPNQKKRVHRLRRSLQRLRGIPHATTTDISPTSIANLVRRLSLQHGHYANALMISQLIIFDASLEIRGSGGTAVLPSILINMATVFEDYMRNVLNSGFKSEVRVEVKDGNRGDRSGAKVALFDPIRAGLKNPTVTPDIVVFVDGRPKLVIDAKYKDGPIIPDRNDINQAILYGARYDADHVMLLHASRPLGRDSIEFCGKIGRFSVYNGMVDLGSDPIVEEEARFAEATRSLLQSHL